MVKMARAIAVAVLVLAPIAVFAQATFQPSPVPTITAENEDWYQDREPIVFAGNLYYSVGSPVFFNRYEMAPNGYYRGVPIYTRTTIEPYSQIFVPLPGGLMQPYERRRAGDLAGTVGSMAPSFPVETSNEAAARTTTSSLGQAQGPPTNVAGSIASTRPPVGMLGPFEVPPSFGRSETAPLPSEPIAASAYEPTPSRRRLSAEKPEGLNGVYVEFQGKRWFSSGPAVPLDIAQVNKIGEYRDFPVYADRRNPDTIYISVAESATGLVAPYTVRRR
jgi:hypothetical protein